MKTPPFTSPNISIEFDPFTFGCTEIKNTACMACRIYQIVLFRAIFNLAAWRCRINVNWRSPIALLTFVHRRIGAVALPLNLIRVHLYICVWVSFPILFNSKMQCRLVWCKGYTQNKNKKKAEQNRTKHSIYKSGTLLLAIAVIWLMDEGIGWSQHKPQSKHPSRKPYVRFRMLTDM